MSSDHAVRLVPEGGPWGRLVITAQDDVDIEVVLDHPLIDDFETFSDDGEGIYDASNYTFLTLFPEGLNPFHS